MIYASFLVVGCCNFHEMITKNRGMDTNIIAGF
jgi:hypothetical protein